MDGANKTTEQLTEEIVVLRQRVAELEASPGQANDSRENFAVAAIEELSDGIIIADANGRIIYVNRAATHFFGTEFSDPDPARWSEYYGIFNPDAVTPMPSKDLPLARALGGESVDEVEGFIRNAANPVGVYVSASSRPVQVGEISGAIVIFRDITERIAMRKAQRLSEERYRLLAENLPNSAVIIYDHDLRFVLVDGPETSTTEYSKEFMEGKTLHEALPPDFVQMVEPNMRAALAGTFFTVELPWEDDRWYRYSYVPLRNQHGDVVMAMILAQNITYFKHVENALRSSEEALTAMINATHDLALLIDRDGRMLLANQRMAASMGSTVEEMVGKTFFELLPPAVAEARWQQGQLVFETGEPVHFQDERAGRTFDNAVYPVFDQNGVVNRVAVFVRDITEIKQSEQHHIDLALNQERVQLLEDLISDLSHDIKTPLTSINNFIYLLGKNTEPAKQAHYLEKLASQTERLNRLVDDILAMSRLDKGPELQFTPLYLNDLLQSIVNGRHHAVDEKDIGLKLELDSDLPPIFGNETELGRAIANLLDNAVNYTPNGGAITLRTDAQVGQINVEIQDTGIGIDVSDMPHIFDRFFRADSARSTSSGGTGLGLAIAKRVIELHGGQISVESAPDKGSSFSFWLPTSVT